MNSEGLNRVQALSWGASAGGPVVLLSIEAPIHRAISHWTPPGHSRVASRSPPVCEGVVREGIMAG